MAKLRLSKSAQNREKTQLRLYKQYLPSLDLKRQQLMAERAKAHEALNATLAKIEELRSTIGSHFPMLANEQVDLAGLVSIKDVKIAEQNLVGVHLPILEKLELEHGIYSFLAKPHWVDGVAMILADLLPLQILAQVETRRVELLDKSVRMVTQRVNLFDKVLIPRSQQNIKKIQIYLSDIERSAVVRAKIAKEKQASEMIE